MHTNELTFNELSAGDFIANDWGHIDVSSYANYTDDEEVCFKLAVWSMQCKYGACVAKYYAGLEYGISNDCQLAKLKIFRDALSILNRYNPRDIVTNTTDYNVMSYSTILDILQILYNKY